jgi:hypothetical protein
VKHILFIQGAGPRVHDEWDNKLVDSLRRELGTGYEVRYPRMPHEDKPTLATWRPALEKDLAALRDGDIVVGHSIGGTLMISVLAESPPKSDLGAIVLISAPFIGKGGWKSDDVHPQSDLAGRLPTNVPVLLYHGDNDKIAPVEHVDLYAAAVPHARVHRLEGRDHQMNNDLSEVAVGIRDLE